MENKYLNFIEILPEKLVEIRRMKNDDAGLIAAWVNTGRRELVFMPGSLTNAEGVLVYQKSIMQEGWDYLCFIIEIGRKPVGYIDFRYKNEIGEILGIFLERKIRNKGIGRHIIHWIIAYLRKCGCKTVSIEVYADNYPSLQVAHNTGFRSDEDSTRYEAEREVKTLRKEVSRFEYIFPPYDGYKKLKCGFHYLHHVAIADAIIQKLEKYTDIEMIFGLGSVSREFADEWSDIDIAILGTGQTLQTIQAGEQWFENYSIDIYLIDVQKSPPEEWDYLRRQAFEESLILFNRKSRLSNKTIESIKLGKKERLNKICETLLEIGWIGFQPRDWYNKFMYGYKWILPHDLWLRRGSLESAHATIDNALNLIIQLLFLLNYRHVPDYKWRRFLVTELPWLPENFVENLQLIEEKSITQKSFEVRSQAVFNIIQQVVKKTESEGILKDDIYLAYLSSSTDYRSI